MKRAVFVIMALLLVQAVPAYALQNLKQSANIKSKHIYDSDIDATGSELGMSDTNFSYGLEFELDNGLPIEMGLNVGHIDIDENDPEELPSHLEYRSFVLGTKFPAFFMNDDRYFMGINIIPTFNTDGYSWESSAFRLPVTTYMIFKESEDLIIILGVLIRTDFEGATVPFLGFIYNPTDYISFNFTSQNPTISFKVNEKTTVFCELEFNFQEFEVTRNAQKNVVLSYNDFSAGIGAEHKFSESWKAKASVGGVFARRFEFEDSLGKVTPGPGLYAAFSLNGSF